MVILLRQEGATISALWTSPSYPSPEEGGTPRLAAKERESREPALSFPKGRSASGRGMGVSVGAQLAVPE